MKQKLMLVLLCCTIICAVSCTTGWYKAFPRQYEVKVWEGQTLILDAVYLDKHISQVNDCLLLKGGDIVFCKPNYTWTVQVKESSR